MGAVRVLVVDDSAVMRRLITRLLESRGEFRVIGTAVDGQEAVEKICALNPDVVSLDLEMPVLDGLGVLRRVMKECPVPVVMLSSHTTAGARATMQALSLGAVDFVAKPSRPGQLDAMVAELVEKLRAAAGVTMRKLVRPPVSRTTTPRGQLSPGTTGRATGSASAAGRLKFPAAPARDATAVHRVPPLVAVPHRPAAHIDLVVVGSSTGGPAALHVLISALPEDFPAAVVLVQHLPVGFSGPMAEHLNHRSRLSVKHAAEGDPVIPGRVLVAPAGFDLTFRGRPGRVTVHLDAGSGPLPPGGFRPSVDGVMLSAAEVFGARVMGVLLTGMGRDGAKGMAAIREKGGPTIAQDESTCVVFGMPKAAIELGAAEKVVPLGEVAREIVRLVF